MTESNYARTKGTKKIYKITKANKSDVFLESQNIKIKVNINEIEIIDLTTIDLDKLSKNDEIQIILNKKEINQEIMLRHKDKETAIKELDFFIDQAILNKLPRVKIIHGIHGGIIKNAVREYLDKCPNILSYKFGESYEGGLGVTIAYLN